MTYILGRLLAAVALAIVLYLPGTILIRWVDRNGELGLLRHLATALLGIATWTTLLFMLATMGLLRTPILWGAVGAVSLAALLIRLRERQMTRPPGESAAGCPRWLVALGSLLLVACLVPLFLLAIAPVVSWDADVYHLTVPKLWLAAGGFVDVDMNVYSQWPLGVELLFALALGIDDFVLAKLLHFVFGLATLWSLGVAARHVERPLAVWPACALFLANEVVLFEMRVAYIDLAYAFFFFSGLLFALVPRGRSLALSAVCVGLLISTKVTSVFGVLAIAAAIAYHAAPKERWKALRLGVILPSLIAGIPWSVKTFLGTGNPIYPFLHEVLGGPDWNASLGAQLRTWQSSIGMGREPLDYLLLPVRVIFEGGQGYENFDGRLTPLLLPALALAIWMTRQGSPAGRFARAGLLATALYFVTWAASSQQIRFLIPILPVIAVAAGFGIEELARRIHRRRAPVLVAAIFVAILGVGIWPTTSTLTAGWRSAKIFLDVGDAVMESAVPQHFRAVDALTPADAKLLMLNTNRGFFNPRSFLADSFFEASQIAAWLAPSGDDPVALTQLLHERGVTHLLSEQVPRGIVYPRSLDLMLADPRFAVGLWQSPDRRFALWQIVQHDEDRGSQR